MGKDFRDYRITIKGILPRDFDTDEFGAFFEEFLEPITSRGFMCEASWELKEGEQLLGKNVVALCWFPDM